MGGLLVNASQSLSPVQFWIWAGISLAAAAGGFIAAFRNLARARMLEDIPTAQVRSAVQGYVELQGRNRLLDGPPIIAPLTGTACTWWAYRIEERSGDRRNPWRRIAEATSEELFGLEDETGICIVDPDGAEVYPMIRRRWYGATARPVSKPRPGRRFAGGRYRYTERRMHAGDPLYAIGAFRTRYLSDDYDTEREMTVLLRDWKRDRKQLLRRFDANGDGDIDLDEWDSAREAARRQVGRERRELRARPGLSVISAPDDGKPFLLGALPQPALAQRLRRRAAAGLVTFFVAGLALSFLAAGRFG